MSASLYLIPNALGEAGAIGDVMPLENCRIAARLDYFVAENAKCARAFLKRVQQQVPLAYALQDIEIRLLNIDTRESELPALLAPVLAGRDAGLVSDAGCPAIADPGALLVRLAHEQGVRVCPLVGPSSLLLALMASGLNGQSFAFRGYLPTDAGQRSERLRELEAQARKDQQTQIFIETPYRNQALLTALAATLARHTRVCVACDLTLPDQWIQTRAAPQWASDVPDLKGRPTVFLLGV